jgi:hypothetical protein
MTTINRKRERLLQKLREPFEAEEPRESTMLLKIVRAERGSGNPLSPNHDPLAIYISRRTLIELLDSDRVVLPASCSMCQRRGISKCDHEDY